MIYVAVAASQTPASVYSTLPDHGYEAVACLFTAFTGTHCGYTWTYSQAELTEVAGCIAKWFISSQTAKITHPIIKRARCRTNMY